MQTWRSSPKTIVSCRWFRRIGRPASLPRRSVTPGYFELLGLELRSGRDFRSTDNRDEPPVAIVNQALAQRYFGDSEPIGKKLWLRGRDREATRIVGVVEDARTDDLTQKATPEI